ncbi:ArsR family transcriptional regulator [Halopelagius longus]|uniref:ArsR family transcriptional regulator n=1 Tax=Halopelagius longus TaxID=1236180 RepID=A0A1H0XP48_9EURY|nr:ArsR family transcriptional regulator [Halopelagius longus]SDQ04687.1 hypothetical protein SAMN05216278_0061 [Halopelagius longus]
MSADVTETATKSDYANLVADIVGHPTGAPTVEELEYMSPSIPIGELQSHLRTLEQTGVIELMETDSHTFCRLTNDAWKEFDERGLFPERPWRRQYSRVQKTTKIERLEEIDRPW